MLSTCPHMVCAQKCYIVSIPCALVVYLIGKPSAFRPIALGLRVYITEINCAQCITIK